MSVNFTSRRQYNKIMLLILVCFFFSGLTGLMYEVLWTRMIVKLIGAAPFAVSIVLTVFMGGLGVGSYIASRHIDRIKEPLNLVWLYGVLELLIGFYGLVLPLLIHLLKPFYAVLYSSLFEQFMLYSILTFIGCAIVLCIPVICMGATLPILCRFTISSMSHIGTHIGRLYGLNTIGAAVGALLCGFWLINYLGVYGTLAAAIALNSIIGIFCIAIGTRVKSLKGDSSSSYNVENRALEDLSEKTGSSILLTGALILFAVSGFCSMAYEVIWAKLLGLMVGPTTYSFTIVLVTFILGLALGSIIFGWIGDRVKNPIWLLLGTQIVAALLALCVSQYLGTSQLFFSKLIFQFKDSFPLLSLMKVVSLFLFMLLPTLCLGATFPLVGRIYTRSINGVGRSIGFAYSINTIGAVLGSFCAGFVLIPLVGKENGLSIVVAVQLLTALFIGGAIVFKEKKGSLRLSALAIPVVAGLIFATLYPAWDRQALSFGKYQRFDDLEIDLDELGWLESFFNGAEHIDHSTAGKLLFYGDGIGGFTTVTRYWDSFGNAQDVLSNSGKPDASSRRDMQTQTLSAHFPLLFHENPKKVMVLGLASGVTAGEVLNYPVEQLDILDISEQVVRASDFFKTSNSHVLSDPRTSMIIQDGRAHLNLTSENYDVIISEPSNPWMAGLAALFTQDFFTLARERLTEDGIFVQFIHSYQMDWNSFALVGRTFESVFPNSMLMLTAPSGQGNDYLLVGFKGDSTIQLKDGLENIQYAAGSSNVRIGDPRLLYRMIVSDELKGLFGDGPVNSDSRPLLEYSAPKSIHEDDPQIAIKLKSNSWISESSKKIIDQTLSDVDLQIDHAAYAMSLFRPFLAMANLDEANAEQQQRFYDIFDEYCRNNPIYLYGQAENALLDRAKQVQIASLLAKMDNLPDRLKSTSYLARLYYDVAEFDESARFYGEALEFAPDDALILYGFALALLRSENALLAIERFEQSIELDPGHTDTYIGLAYALLGQGDVEGAIEQYQQALAIDPNNQSAKDGLYYAYSLIMDPT